MAIGWTPKFDHELGLAGIDEQHFLAIAIEAAKELGWNLVFLSETGFICNTKFSWKSYGEQVTLKIDNGFANIMSECNGNQFIDWGKNKKNVESFLDAYDKKNATLTTEQVEAKVEELKQSFVPKEEDVLSQPPATAIENITGFFSMFKPVNGYFITPILISINILIFLTMLVSGVHIISPEGSDLILWGANFKPLTLEGEWWRLLSACFLHIGIFHLLLNMYALIYIGFLLEPYLGKSRFIAAYLVTGVASSVASLWWNDLTISAGASGAIFGMYGVFLALLTTNLLEKSARQSLLASILVFVGYNLLGGFKANSGVDNAAHIGGLISGLLIGYAFIPSLKHQGNTRVKYSTISALIAVLLISTSFIYRSLPNHIAQYEDQMNRFTRYESLALEVFRLPEDTPEEELLFQLKDRGIYYWKEGLNVLDSAKMLDLPKPIQNRNDNLRKYCELRIRNYELLYKGIAEHTNKYEEEIGENDRKLGGILYELNNK